nr:RHS repeat-associated core domain-containing protein [Candidatus Palauibacterales bacterium]
QHGSTTVSNWLRYAGQMLDWHEGLYAMGARSYDPELGRFLSEDPLGLAAGINPYAYVGDSPPNGTDPMGLDPICTPGWWDCPVRPVQGLFVSVEQPFFNSSRANGFSDNFGRRGRQGPIDLGGSGSGGALAGAGGGLGGLVHKAGSFIRSHLPHHSSCATTVTGTIGLSASASAGGIGTWASHGFGGNLEFGVAIGAGRTFAFYWHAGPSVGVGYAVGLETSLQGGDFDAAVASSFERGGAGAFELEGALGDLGANAVVYNHKIAGGGLSGGEGIGGFINMTSMGGHTGCFAF